MSRWIGGPFDVFSQWSKLSLDMIRAECVNLQAASSI